MNLKSKMPAGIVAAFLAALDGKSAPWAVVALATLLLLTAGCTIDAERIGREGEKLQIVCAGAKTTYLRMLCENAGVDTAPGINPN